MAMQLRRYTWTLVTAASLAATGCASTGAVAPRAAVASAPAEWQTPAEGVSIGTSQDLSRWWDALGDTTLSGVIERALASNTDIRIAQARLRQARAERNIARAALLPGVTASGGATARKDGGTALSAGFDASWEPDLFGATRASVTAAGADVQAVTEDLHATQVSLSAEVAANYAELRTTQARLEIARRNEASQAETLELTTFRAQAGLVSSVDVEQARANLEQTRAQIPSLEASISQLMHRIATLSGLAPTTLDGELSAAAPLPSIPAQVAATIPAETLRQRPDVRAAEQRVVAETLRLAVADKNRLPQFTLSGSIGTEAVAGVLSGGTSIVASAAASVLQTIFDGGRIRQQIAIQSAVQEQAVTAYEATVLTSLEDVENALVSFETARRRLDSLNEAMAAANAAALLAQSQYTAGLADFQRVLDTERTALSVQDTVAGTQGDRLTALIQLYKALGGGWSPAGDTL